MFMSAMIEKLITGIKKEPLFTCAIISVCFFMFPLTWYTYKLRVSPKFSMDLKIQEGVVIDQDDDRVQVEVDDVRFISLSLNNLLTMEQSKKINQFAMHSKCVLEGEILTQRGGTDQKMLNLNASTITCDNELQRMRVYLLSNPWDKVSAWIKVATIKNKKSNEESKAIKLLISGHPIVEGPYNKTYILEKDQYKFEDAKFLIRAKIASTATEERRFGFFTTLIKDIRISGINNGTGQRDEELEFNFKNKTCFLQGNSSLYGEKLYVDAQMLICRNQKGHVVDQIAIGGQVFDSNKFEGIKGKIEQKAAATRNFKIPFLNDSKTIFDSKADKSLDESTASELESIRKYLLEQAEEMSKNYLVLAQDTEINIGLDELPSMIEENNKKPFSN